jgi:hypothetical protein
MTRYTTRIQQNSVSIPTSVTCDFCGITYKDPQSAPCTAFSIQPGYGSVYDDDRYSLDICDGCLAKLLVGEEVSLVENMDMIQMRSVY